MKGARVLIAEDEGLIAEELRDRLERAGYVVTAVVGTGDAAVERALETTPDLLLMDIRLKGRVDGVEAVRRIGERLDVPVVYLTAHSDDATLERAKRTSPYGYLIKPFAERELATTIDVAIHKHRADARRRQAEEQRQQTLKLSAVGRLAGGVAHYINNDMTVVLGCAEIMLEHLPPDDALRPLAGDIRKAADRSATVAKRLIAFSRQQILNPTPVLLNYLLRTVDATLRRTTGAEIAIAYDLEPSLDMTRVDSTQMRKAILHLALNARDSMPEGGTLTFQTRNMLIADPKMSEQAGVPQGDWVMLAINDTGAGMDEHSRAHAFEPFFTTKEIGEGVGLSLPAIYGFIKQSDGEIFLESGPGKGTCFRIFLPRVDDNAP